MSLAQASVWSPLTSAHWAEETLNPSAIDPELLPLVQQAMPLVMPQVELAARRAWVPGKMDGARSQLSDPWERAATDDGAGYSRVELEEVGPHFDMEVLCPFSFMGCSLLYEAKNTCSRPAIKPSTFRV